SSNVDLDLNLSFSRNQNEVVDIGDLASLTQDATIGQFHVPGFPVAGIFFRRVVSATIDNSGARPVATNVMCEGGDVVPGTSFSKGGGTPVACASAPLVYWGQPIPSREGSASATLTLFGKLQLYGLVDYVGGHQLVSGDIAAVHRFFLNSREILERDDPILLGYEATGQIWQPGIIDGSFAKLRTLSVNYRLPRSWASSIRAAGVSVTAAFENVATLWVGQRESFGHRQMDPEVRWSANTGTTQGLSAYNQEGWPQLKKLAATVRITY
ncbi:MAG: hypothetical protein HYW52_02235, partial [Gemmatimonadetes bacterium]|nr:hypothetical protein [Gemmatimonadota bacterium]